MKLIFTCTIIILSIASMRAQIYVKHDATGSNDGTSWTNAFTYLQDALDAANPSDQIWISAGTYKPTGPSPDSTHFILAKSVTIYGGFAGSENSLGERNLQINLTIMSGDINGDDTPGDYFLQRSDNAHHIFIIDAGQSEIIVDGLIFKGGTTRLDAYVPNSTDVSGIDRWRGGAIFIRNSPTVIRNCLFIDNHAYQGSAFFARNTTLDENALKVEHSKFESNSVLDGGIGTAWPWNNCLISHCIFQQNLSGGYSAGLVIVNSNARIEDCGFDQNFASRFGGACFFTVNSNNVVNHPTIQFTRCSFTGNTAGNAGGAFQFYNYFFNSSLSFDSCTFSKNKTLISNFGGGAIYVKDFFDEFSNEPSNSIRINQCSFIENEAKFGSAIEILAVDDSLNLEVSGTEFINNATQLNGSGSLYIGLGYDAILHAKINQTIFDGNNASYSGGAILFDNYANAYPLEYEIKDCVFKNNIAETYGGALGQFNYSGAGQHGLIQNSQFINNQGLQTSGAIYSYKETLSIENCLFEENFTAGNFSASFNGGGAISLDDAKEVIIRNSIFSNNESENEGSALFIFSSENTRLENVLMNENGGNSTIYNWGNLMLLNSTITNNEYGLVAHDSSLTEIQNSIFNNIGDNLFIVGTGDIISNGGNISSDGTMSDYLTGFGSYNDFHNTQPLLGPDLFPIAGSPCIDAGNPDGVTAAFDLAGNPRVQGNNIDIGCYEVLMVAVDDVNERKTSLAVFPNPVHDILHIQLESEWIGLVQIDVKNDLGQLVQSVERNKSATKEILIENVSGFPSGNYILNITAGHSTKTIKFIKLQ